MNTSVTPKKLRQNKNKLSNERITKSQGKNKATT